MIRELLTRIGMINDKSRNLVNKKSIEAKEKLIKTKIKVEDKIEDIKQDLER